MIIQSKVIGKVPSFIFVIDPKASEEKTVDRILASENFDTGPLEDVENLMISDGELIKCLFVDFKFVLIGINCFWVSNCCLLYFIDSHLSLFRSAAL